MDKAWSINILKILFTEYIRVIACINLGTQKLCNQIWQGYRMGGDKNYLPYTITLPKTLHTYIAHLTIVEKLY